MAGELTVVYDRRVEEGISKIIELLKGEYRLTRRSIALLLIQGDEEIRNLVRVTEGERFGEIEDAVEEARKAFGEDPKQSITFARQRSAEAVLEGAITHPEDERMGIAERISRIMINPIMGIPILLLVVYFGLYKFVGGFGAGTVVDFIEGEIFETHVIPWVNNLIQTYIPWKVIQDLIGNEYGIITLGLRYAIAIILPIVGTFFLAFSVIEDTGYLPRLALLIDRVFKKIGLSGRAVIPMTLGFGCDTMATMVSRTLETKKEKIIATFLLALAIPCSAQLGVILGLLSGEPKTLMVWAVFLVLVFLLIGFLTAKVIPGEKPGFYMELPPLRLPNLRNILVKTYTRMHWYFIEVLPLFIIASVIIWFGNLFGLFEMLVGLIKPIVNFLGLPDKAAEAFLFGFFRRDYGAAGLYDLQSAGALTPKQLVVAAATLTIFVPCVAQFIMMIKERGAKTAIAMAAFIIPFAFACGYLMKLFLTAIGW